MLRNSINTDYHGKYYTYLLLKYIVEPSPRIQHCPASNSEVVESNEEKPGVIIDYDQDRHIVGIEYLDASSKMEIPEKLIFEVIYP